MSDLMSIKKCFSDYSQDVEYIILKVDVPNNEPLIYVNFADYFK
jgi:hypothetical protein